MHRQYTIATWVLCLLLICSCSQAVQTPDAPSDAQAEEMKTTIAVAVEATLTMIASVHAAAPAGTAVNTPVPTPTTMAELSATALRPTAAPTVSLSSCTFDSDFESDVTIPDNSKIAFSTEFTKTWAIKNNGTCDWQPGFALRPAGGDRLSESESAPVPPAKAGETVQVSVRMKAPDDPGTYISKWQLCASADQCFGAVLFSKIIAVQP